MSLDVNPLTNRQSSHFQYLTAGEHRTVNGRYERTGSIEEREHVQKGHEHNQTIVKFSDNRSLFIWGVEHETLQCRGAGSTRDQEVWALLFLIALEVFELRIKCRAQESRTIVIAGQVIQFEILFWILLLMHIPGWAVRRTRIGPHWG